MDAFAAGNLDVAVGIQQQSIDMITLLGKYGGIATGKAFMKLIGMDCGKFRLPVRNMDEASFAAFQSDANGVGFYSFCSLLGKKDEIETALMHQEQ
jgi:N-acetylneuraminate lyase